MMSSFFSTEQPHDGSNGSAVDHGTGKTSGLAFSSSAPASLAPGEMPVSPFASMKAGVQASASDGVIPPAGHGNGHLHASVAPSASASAVAATGDDTTFAGPPRISVQGGSSGAPSLRASFDSAMSSSESKLPSLLRLFESEFFNMTMALMYLYRYSDSDVQEYLCQAMKRFPQADVEFFLPQLLTIFMHQPHAYQHLRSLLLDQSARSVHFSLLLTWLLQAEIDTQQEPDRLNAAVALHRSILSTDVVMVPEDPPVLPDIHALRRAGRGHRRTKSDVIGSPSTARHDAGSGLQRLPRATSSSSSLLRPAPKRSDSSTSLMDLGTGRAFGDEGSGKSQSSTSLVTSDTLHNPLAPAPDSTDGVQALEKAMAPELNFVNALNDIGTRLVRFPTRNVRRTQLYAELALLNLNLPARVFLPLRIGSKGGALGSRTGRDRTRQGAGVSDHHVVRIPPHEAVILNSKEKVPYMIQVEVVDCKSYQSSPVPHKLTLKQRKTKAVHRRSVSESGARTPQEKTLATAESPQAEREGVFKPGDIRRQLSQASRAGKSKFENHHDDPSAKALKENWVEKIERIRTNSPYGHLPNWRLIPMIVKCGDDLRQELLASQLLHLFQEAWQEEQLSLWLRPLRILVTSNSTGMVEVIGSAVSLHQTKKHKGAGFTLLDYFKEEYGGMCSERFLQAQRNYVESLAAYSLFCYFVQVKDRHNGNILIDGEGHILHIDFGFMLSSSPGRNMGFENAPFKLTDEFVEVMGGVTSDMFMYFKMLLLKGFVAARKHMDRFTTTVEVMHKSSHLPCFVGGPGSVQAFKERFQLGLTEQQLVVHVEELLGKSMENLTTRLYDGFQYLTNGIM
eukprot:m.87996 g.87996  ORF g.87996 m.87996 type:complete len:849 (-) comp14925_c1_seq1:48-2594(-)